MTEVLKYLRNAMINGCYDGKIWFLLDLRETRVNVKP
jgi:hypothetical protein